MSKIQRHNECMLERISTFITQFPDILLLVSKQGDRRISLKLVDLVTDKLFEINILSGLSMSSRLQRYIP